MFTSEKNSSVSGKEFAVTSAVILFCLVLSVVFPVDNSFQGLTKGLFFLFVVPVFYVIFVLKRDVGSFGLNVQNKQVGAIWGISMLFVSFAAIFFLVKFSPFLANYKVGEAMRESFWIFVLNMLVFSNIVLFYQEYFFRGFVMLYASRRISVWSIPFQAIIYFLAVLIVQKGFSSSLWQFAPSIILSVTGGITAYKTRSIIYSWISGLIFLIALSAYSISVVK